MYYPVGDTHGNQTLYNIRYNMVKGQWGDVWQPSCWFGFFLDLVVCLTFFTFKSQRKFPTCLLGTMCLIDMLHFLRELIKGSPIGWIGEKFFWSAGPTECGTIYLWVVYIEAAQFVVAIAISVVVYMTIVKKQDMKYAANPRFFKIVVLSLAIYPVVYSIVVGLTTIHHPFTRVLTACAPQTAAPSIIGMCQCLIAVVILSVLIGKSLKYIWGILRNVSAMADAKQTDKAWVTIRFILIVILTTIPRVDYNLIYFVSSGAVPTLTLATIKNFAWSSVITMLTCYYLNAVVVVWNNKPLHKWLKRRYIDITSSGSTSNNSNSGKYTPQQDRDSKNIKDVEMNNKRAGSSVGEVNTTDVEGSGV